MVSPVFEWIAQRRLLRGPQGAGIEVGGYEAREAVWVEAGRRVVPLDGVHHRRSKGASETVLSGFTDFAAPTYGKDKSYGYVQEHCEPARRPDAEARGAPTAVRDTSQSQCRNDRYYNDGEADDDARCVLEPDGSHRGGDGIGLNCHDGDVLSNAGVLL